MRPYARRGLAVMRPKNTTVETFRVRICSTSSSRSKYSPASVPGAHPGALFVHWLGDKPETTNLTEFEPDALVLARDGVTSVLIDAMWSAPGWFNKVRTPGSDYDNSIKQVVDLRRALDLLLAQADVDRGRIAYVGHVRRDVRSASERRRQPRSILRPHGRHHNV